jgi:hypothetical protein
VKGKDVHTDREERCQSQRNRDIRHQQYTDQDLRPLPDSAKPSITDAACSFNGISMNPKNPFKPKTTIKTPNRNRDPTTVFDM